MEKVTNEDGFNVVVTRCDHCQTEISNLGEADQQWFTVSIKPLVRDEWALGIDQDEMHFCSTECFRKGLSGYDPDREFDSYLEEENA